MKRLLLSLTAALALGAYADTGDYGGTGFESLTPGNALDITKDDTGDDGAGFWAGEGEEFGVISNHTEAVEVAGLDGKNNYLKFEADSTLYRYAIDNAQPTRTIDVSNKAGIYFDSLVQFTGSEEIMVNNEADRAKLAVWLYQCDTEDGAYGIGTNLIVTAGYLNSANSSTATNYVTTLNLTEGWHRLTVKMIPEIGTDTGVAGFVVFVDGVEVQNAEVKGDVGSVMDALNATAAKWADKNALFPSMISTGAKDAQTFECVGFKGQGALDELLVTENAPDFAADSTFFTLNWDAGLASLTIDEDPVEGFVEGEAGFTVITVTAAGSTYTVAAVAKDGYNLGARTVDESGNIVISGNDFVVNGTGVGNIVVNQTKFLVNGQPYSTLEDAIEAAGEGGTIKLNVDIEFDPDIEGDLIALDSDNFVFDLAGHTITLLSETNSPIEIDEFSTLKIIDSVGGGKLVGGDGGSIYSLGVLIIGDADGNNDKGVTFDGAVCIDGGECLIVRGNFDKQNEGEELESYKDENSTITDDGDYYVVTPNGEPPVPPTYVVEIVGGKQYETLADALADAKTGAEIKFLDNLELAESIEVEGKDITFDLNGKTVAFTGCSGFYFLGCDGAITNGTVTMDVPATADWLFAINFEKGNGLVKDVTVNAGNCKYGVTSSCDDCGDDNFNDATVVCENVDVSGSGMLFYAESQKMTLDEKCSATQTGENAAGAVHSDALAAGWLGQLTVNGGEYTAEGNVIATMSSPANIKLVAGTFSGAVTITPVSEGYKEMGDHIIVKAEDVDLDAPAGYVWADDAEEGFVKLVKITEVTPVVSIEEPVVAYVADMEFPEVIVEGDYVENVDYTVAWDAEKILEPEAGATNVYVATVTMQGKYTGSNTTELKVFKEKQAEDWPDPEKNPEIIGKSAQDVFGDKVPEALAGVPASKFSAWAKRVGLDFANPGEINVDAYLLDCAPAEVEAKKAEAVAQIKIASIQFEDDKWVVTTVGGKVEGQSFNTNAKLQLLEVTDTIEMTAGQAWKMTLVPDTTPDNN